jgi:hypothetical protein
MRTESRNAEIRRFPTGLLPFRADHCRSRLIRAPTWLIRGANRLSMPSVPRSVVAAVFGEQRANRHCHTHFRTAVATGIASA